MAHSRETVARVKGAAKIGLRAKVIGYLFGLPVETVKEWLSEDCRAEIEPDMSVENDVREALLGRFVGRESAR